MSRASSRAASSMPAKIQTATAVRVNSRPTTARIARLPALVAPPPDGTLCLRPVMRQPTCNIAVDQRVCRGSVFAARRQAALKEQTERDEQGKETEYKVGVLRSQLESSLPQVALPRTRPHRGRGDHRLSYRKVQLPTMAPQSIDKEFRNVKLLPLKTTGNHVEKLVPSTIAPYPVTNWSSVRIGDTFVTPPPHNVHRYLIVESAVQTDDDFEQEAVDLIRELANSAIARAIETLETEKQLESLRREAEETRRVLERERKKQLETEHRVRWTIGEKDRIIAESRQREEDSKTSKALAVQTCREVTLASLSKLQELEALKPKMKSIGMDTRPLNSKIHQLDLVTIELEKDFFPWIFGKAERVFRQKLACVHLENAIFTEVSLERKQAREKLQPSFT